MKKKLLLSIISLGFIGLLFYYFAWSLSPGSYAKSETYLLTVPEDTLIAIIQEVKAEYRDIAPQPERYPDGKRSYWYSIYFQYQDNQQHIHTWTRKKNKIHTTFAFAGYKDANSMEGWIAANEYFWWWKNSDAKTKFETNILKKIKAKIEERGL